MSVKGKQETIRMATAEELAEDTALRAALNSYCEKNHITQKMAGERLGHSQSYVSKLFKPRQMPCPFEELLTYAQAVSISRDLGGDLAAVLQSGENALAKKVTNYDSGAWNIPVNAQNIPDSGNFIPEFPFGPEDKLVNDVSDPMFDGWFGTYHCYFYSTISTETESRCFHGILDIPRADSGCCCVSFEFAYDKARKRRKKYYGHLTLSRTVQGAYCTLLNHGDQGEISYLIMGDPQLNNSRVCCVLALVLTISGGKNTRRPCVERMIISREELSGRQFRLARAHLLLNDKYIRVTESRFAECLADEAMPDNFRAMFPKPEEDPPFDNSRLTDYVCRVAEIPESWVKSLKGYTDRQKQEIIDCLRLYSTAPRCNKIRQESAERDIFELFEEQYSSSLLLD